MQSGLACQPDCGMQPPLLSAPPPPPLAPRPFRVETQEGNLLRLAPMRPHSVPQPGGARPVAPELHGASSLDPAHGEPGVGGSKPAPRCTAPPASCTTPASTRKTGPACGQCPWGSPHPIPVRRSGQAGECWPPAHHPLHWKGSPDRNPCSGSNSKTTANVAVPRSSPGGSESACHHHTFPPLDPKNCPLTPPLPVGSPLGAWPTLRGARTAGRPQQARPCTRPESPGSHLLHGDSPA